jgi:diguanylate cyclase (GGDEF)-like protein
MLLPDLVVVAGFTFLFHDMEDAFYPVAIFLAIAYALVARRHDIWLVGAAVAAAYLVGHVVSGHENHVQSLAFIGFRALSIPAIGAIVASSVSRQRVREEDAVRAVADEADAKQQLESRLAELQAIARITETVHSSLDLDRIGPQVLEVLGGVMGIQTCSLLVIDTTDSQTVFSASIGDASGKGADVRTSPESTAHLSCRTVCERGNALVLFCANDADMLRMTVADELVLSAVANQLVVAVENSNLFGLTKVLAITDELTGLYNYRELQTRLNQEVDRATRYESTLSLLMIDADGFKDYNDAHGHIAGDSALTELGAVMRSAVREVDMVARYGGEEFTIILPETDAAGAFVVAEKIREAVADHVFPDAAGEPCCSLTVSVGIATFPTHAVDKESLLREADDALYRAKHEGKNRVRTPQGHKDSSAHHTMGD